MMSSFVRGELERSEVWLYPKREASECEYAMVISP